MRTGLHSTHNTTGIGRRVDSKFKNSQTQYIDRRENAHQFNTSQRGCLATTLPQPEKPCRPHKMVQANCENALQKSL
jgi:hypothetical protein